MRVGVGGGNETAEERVGLVWFAVEFGVELAGDEERMLGQFNDLDQLAVGGKSAKDKVRLFEPLAIGIVEFVTMPVALVDDKGAIKPGGFCADHQLAGLGAQQHSAAFFGYPGLFVQHRNHRMKSVW